jgi:hypothetical protein
MLLSSLSTVDQIAPWLVIAVGFLGNAWISKRGAVGDALGYLERTNRLQHEELQGLKKERQENIAEIAALRSRTDFSRSLIPIMEAIKEHELQTETRFVGTLRILNLIARQLGADEVDIDAES